MAIDSQCSSKQYKGHSYTKVQVIQRFIKTGKKIRSRSGKNGRGAHAQKGGEAYRCLLAATEALTDLPLVKEENIYPFAVTRIKY